MNYIVSFKITVAFYIFLSKFYKQTNSKTSDMEVIFKYFYLFHFYSCSFVAPLNYHFTKDTLFFLHLFYTNLMGACFLSSSFNELY